MLHYLIGNAVSPVRQPAVICHIVNDCGKWRSGFALDISGLDERPEYAYNTWYNTITGKGNEFLPLGETQIISLDTNIAVANMVAQHDTKAIFGTSPIKHDALEMCLCAVNDLAIQHDYTIHMPRIGVVRSNADWKKIEEIIMKQVQVETYVYTLEVEKDMWDTQYEN